MSAAEIKAPTCDECGEVAHRVAVDTGEGWSLGWDCSCGQAQDYPDIPWPFEGRVTADELRAAGFEIV